MQNVVIGHSDAVVYYYELHMCNTFYHCIFYRFWKASKTTHLHVDTASFGFPLRLSIDIKGSMKMEGLFGLLWTIAGMIALSCRQTSTLRPDLNSNGIRATLLHRDHNLLSGVNQSKSTEERLVDAVQQSIFRVHHLESMRRRHINAVESTLVFSREGSYVMNISLGTPPRSFLLVADTGSDLTWVQCRPCLHCFDPRDAIFDPTTSASYKSIPCSGEICKALRVGGNDGSCTDNVGCTYDIHYADGSRTTGDYSMETLTLGTLDGNDMDSKAFAFGCGHNNTGKFMGIDGLVGLGQGSLSFPSQISHLVAEKFSYCLVSFFKAKAESSHIVFGSEAAVDSLDMRFTPLVNNTWRPSNYYVDMESIEVDGMSLGISPLAFKIHADGFGGTFLDSGTSVTHLVRPAYGALVEFLKSTIKYPAGDGSYLKLDLCFDTTGIASPKFPAIQLRLKGADFELPTENSFISIDRKGTMCLAMVPSKYYNVIGNFQMQNFRFLYDRENSRVGFKPEQCNSGY